MAHEDDRVKRGDAMWRRFTDVVPPEKLAAPVPQPQAAPVPEPAPASSPSEEAKVRDIKVQIEQDRRKASQEQFKIARDAQEAAFKSMQDMHETQNKMNP
jgi:hypothetical protein